MFSVNEVLKLHKNATYIELSEKEQRVLYEYLKKKFEEPREVDLSGYQEWVNKASTKENSFVTLSKPGAIVSKPNYNYEKTFKDLNLKAP